jgi:hypothetical protein
MKRPRFRFANTKREWFSMYDGPKQPDSALIVAEPQGLYKDVVCFP